VKHRRGGKENSNFLDDFEYGGSGREDEAKNWPSTSRKPPENDDEDNGRTADGSYEENEGEIARKGDVTPKKMDYAQEVNTCVDLFASQESSSAEGSSREPKAG